MQCFYFNVDDSKMHTLTEKKKELMSIRKNKIEGVMLRSRCRYQDLGEKPTNYFFNFENRNYTGKGMNNLLIPRHKADEGL